MFRFGDPGGRIYAALGSSNANVLALWTAIQRTADWSIVSGGGRNGGTCLRLAGVATNCYLARTLDAQATWGLAFAYKINSAITASQICALVDSTTAQVDLRLNADGTLSITRNGTVLGSSSFAIGPNAYHHLELKVKIDPTAGTAELRVDGVTVIGPLTGLNTRNTANSSANVVAIGAYSYAPNNFGPADYDDLVVWDGQTTDANGGTDIHDFIGDCRLVWLPPNGAGTTTQWTATGAGSNYACVDEATPDGDTTYVADGTVGDIDTYALTDLPATAAAVKSVASILYARKDDAGSRSIAPVLRSAGGNAAHAATISLGNSYQYYLTNWGQDPNNGTPAAWTVAAVNALEAGQKVTS